MKDPEIILGIAQPHGTEVVSRVDLEKTGVGLAHKTACERWLSSPGWVSDSGEGHVVFVSNDNKTVREAKKSAHFGVVFWRWNIAPTTYVSLTLVGEAFPQRPFVRWFGRDSDAVVQAIKRTATAKVIIVNPEGNNSGWFEVTFGSSPKSPTPAPKIFERQWTFPTRGIPCTNKYEPIELDRKDPYNDECRDEIELWESHEADYWETIAYKGPWEADKNQNDRIVCKWAKAHFRHRSRFGLEIEIIKKFAVDSNISLSFYWITESGRVAASALNQK